MYSKLTVYSLSTCSTIRQPIQTLMRDAVVAILEQLVVNYPPVAAEVDHLEKVVGEIQTPKMKRNQKYPMQIAM